MYETRPIGLWFHVTRYDQFDIQWNLSYPDPTYQVHQLLFSEDLGKNINSSTSIRIHIASRNFSALSHTF